MDDDREKRICELERRVNLLEQILRTTFESLQAQVRINKSANAAVNALDTSLTDIRRILTRLLEPGVN